MRRFAICCLLVVLAACAKKEAMPAADTTAAMAPAPPPMLMLSDVAGKWSCKVMGESSDSVVTTYELTATADTMGWVQTLANRPPIALHIMTGGDSLVMHAGPFASVLRKGLQVSTEGVSRMEGGMLKGMIVAHYKTTKPDSVARLRTECTRAP